MPNRRRRKLSTAMRAVAAVAVAGPFAVLAVSELSGTPEAAPQQREFVQASLVSDLSGELMSALSQGLAQFGINIPPLPNVMGSTGAQPPSFGPVPSLGLDTLGATTNPLGTLGATTNPLGTLGVPVTPQVPGLNTVPLTGDALTDMTLTPPMTPGLEIPTAGASNLGVTVPGALPTIPTDIGSFGEQSIGGLNTYPLMGGPLAMPAPSTGSGLFGAADQLGVTDAINLVKGIVMPLIMSGVQSAAAAGAAAPAAAVPGA